MRMSPTILTARQIDVLLSHLPGVRDADVDHVHDARVATRRLRELLPLAGVETGSSARKTSELVRDAGRALGTVRELDTLLVLCRDLGDAHPHAAGTLAMARSRLQIDRGNAARRLVKRLERLGIEQLREEIRPGRATFLTSPAPWRTACADRLAARATKLGAAIAHASGVYLPNRLHRVRVHLKKLRYLAEIASETGLWQPAHLRRDAARVQEMLGDIHDRQVLLERLEQDSSDAAVIDALRAEIALRHARYLTQRPRLSAMVDACHRFAEHERHRRRRLMSGAAAALLVPAGIALLRSPLLIDRDAA